MSVHYPNPRANTRLAIRSLKLTETGTYTQQFNRPYDTFIDQGSLDSLTRRVSENPTGNTRASTIAGTVGNILMPSASPLGAIHIPNGWSDKRLRFILEVEVETMMGTRHIDYFQGYTSYLGIGDAMNNFIDPTMEFFINSHTRVNQVNEQTPMGMAVREIVSESNHVINGTIVAQSEGMDQSRLIRPQDIFSSIQEFSINDTNLGYGNFDRVTDTRTRVSGKSNISQRSHSIPTTYLATVVDSYNQGLSTAEFGVGAADIYGRSKESYNELYVTDIPFIRQLSNIKGLSGVTSFSLNDLAQIDPNVPNVTHATRQSAVSRTTLPDHTQGQYWNGSDTETIMATALSTAVPAIASELLFSKIAFSVTNHTVGGQVHMEIFPENTLAMTSADVRSHYTRFQNKVERELLYDLSYQNQITYSIYMDTTWAGDTFISISINGGPSIDFVSPSFGDSLIIPTYTSSEMHHQKIVGDLEQLMNQTGMSQMSDTINTSI